MSGGSTSLTGVTHAPEPPGFLPERTAAASSWRWRFLDASGAETTVTSDALPTGTPTFPSQSDAESWVGEQWRDLLEAGVEAVTLLDGDRTVYGPMSLRPPGG